MKLPNNVIPFQYMQRMPTIEQAIERHISNLIATMGREAVLEYIKREFQLVPAVKSKTNLKLVG